MVRFMSVGFRALYRQISSASSRSSSTKPFEKVLIANRGEIASRVMRTCEQLGIKTVAIYSTADSKAPFVAQADEAICVGPASSSQSYLCTDNIVAAIKATNAQALHPGYGFLSENAKFSEDITEMGIQWLGPSPSAVREMGDKIRSKEIAQAAGVNIIPGFDGELMSIDHALQVAKDIGYPILLKAANGGGGKGMRVCQSDTDVKEGFGLAKSEALKFFSDDRLLIEKYVENPHHIEFQVMAAFKPGNKTTEDMDIIVFCERECSIQRRHQKIIEESPSPMLKEVTRLKMVEQVKALVKKVGYTSAGTVEFLVDEEQNFYFLEMNTRLQVEHPVTEAVSGNIDLVKAMLWVGAGWGIPEDMKATMGDSPYYPHFGHAVEARIYAEDPVRGFLPSTGPLVPYQEPPNVRVDSGVAEGHVVSPHYDPMLSKVIAWKETRLDAIEALSQAMDEYVIGDKIQHNARLVNDVLRSKNFRSGHTPTSFLEKQYGPEGFRGVQLNETEQLEFAVSVAWIDSMRRKELGVSSLGETVVVRLSGMFGDAHEVSLNHSSKSATAVILCEKGAERSFSLDSVEYKSTDLIAKISLNGHLRSIQVLKERTTGELQVQMYGALHDVLLQTPREYVLSKYMHAPLDVDTSDMLLSPMPGTLVSYAISEGDNVVTGQELCVVEAMKMQNIIRSPRSGTIGALKVKVGNSLRSDELILEFEEVAETMHAATV